MPSRKQHSKRKYRKQCGGDSASYGFGPAVSPGAPYASEVVAREACLAATRPGTLVNYSAGSGGLPGLTGGGTRSKRKQRGGKRFSLKNLMKSARSFFLGRRGKKQRGGRWTANVGATTSGPNPFVPVSRIACEGGMVNTSPPGAAPATMSFKQMGGVGGVASPYYSASTAGYGNTASTWVSSTGTPSLLQTPYEARTMNPACLKTGGGKRRNKKKNSRKRSLKSRRRK